MPTTILVFIGRQTIRLERESQPLTGECRKKCLLGNAVGNKQSQLKGLVIQATIKKTIE